MDVNSQRVVSRLHIFMWSHPKCVSNPPVLPPAVMLNPFPDVYIPSDVTKDTWIRK